MKRLLPALFALTIALTGLSVSTYAHFKLLEPADWIKYDEKHSWVDQSPLSLGDPQKVGPCGGDPKGQNEKILTGIVTKVTGGSKLHIKVEETVYHSGHYRIALAVNSRNELPTDPMTVEKYVDRVGAAGYKEKGLFSVWAAIQSPPQIPVIADGVFQHYPKPGEPGSHLLKEPMTPWETDVELPNISCPKCTLQVIQFMADHINNQPGSYTYHHCADLQITADASKPADKGWPVATSTN